MNLFAYGLLASGGTLGLVIGDDKADTVVVKRAILKDHVRFREGRKGVGGLYCVQPEKGEYVDGVVIFGLDDRAMERLDGFEPRRVYQRQTVTAEVDGVPTECEIYMAHSDIQRGHIVDNARFWARDKEWWE